MAYKDTSEQLARYRDQITQTRNKMRELQRTIEPEEVADYEFLAATGRVRLSDLFGDKDDLFVIHNMGTTCPSCTMWADGFNGILQHIEDRAAFVVSSPDDPATQRAFAASRGWRFRMVSHQGSSFAGDMGYRGENHWYPGVSVFKKRGGKILRVGDTSFSPGDDFCSIWHFLDLIPEGAGSWRPQFNYG